MNFTDIFIRRPVLASVVSLMILVIGIRSFSSLQVLAYPKTENGVVTISTAYPGRRSGVDRRLHHDPDRERPSPRRTASTTWCRSSQSGTSTISVNLRQNYDTSKAAAEINIKVNSVLNQLPAGSQQPVITVQVGQTTPAMFLGFASTTLAQNQITDYLQRVVQPKLQAVPGVQTAQFYGAQTVLAARLARSAEARRLRPDGHRRDQRARRKRLHLRGRKHQGPDGPGDLDLDDQPA